jgi:hypothetical protein
VKAAEGSGSTPAAEILWPRYSNSWTPHILLSVDHETVVLKSLQDLPHVDHMLLVVSAADDDVVYPGKGA